MDKAGLEAPGNFTGYTYDVTLELYFAQSRFYDAADHRFISEDGAQDGSNWYIYCRDNPVSNTDIWGRSTLAAMKEKYGFTEVWLHDRIVVSGKTLENLLAKQAAINSRKVREEDFCLEVDILLNGQKKRYTGAYDGDGVFVSSRGIPMTDDAVFEKDWRYIYNLGYEKKNKDRMVDAEGYITDQNASVFDKMYYGSRPISYNGCELTAIYNALHFLGRNAVLSDIINYYENGKGMWMGGELGTIPIAIPSYFSNYACLRVEKPGHPTPVTSGASPSDLSDMLTEKNVLILSVINPNPKNGIHTFIAIREGDRLKFYNAYSKEPEFYDSVNDFLQKRKIKFICEVFFVAEKE